MTKAEERVVPCNTPAAHSLTYLSWYRIEWSPEQYWHRVFVLNTHFMGYRSGENDILALMGCYAAYGYLGTTRRPHSFFFFWTA